MVLRNVIHTKFLTGEVKNVFRNQLSGHKNVKRAYSTLSRTLNCDFVWKLSPLTRNYLPFLTDAKRTHKMSHSHHSSIFKLLFYGQLLFLIIFIIYFRFYENAF
jgi:hypothetical protein